MRRREGGVQATSGYAPAWHPCTHFRAAISLRSSCHCHGDASVGVGGSADASRPNTNSHHVLLMSLLLATGSAAAHPATAPAAAAAAAVNVTTAANVLPFQPSKLRWPPPAVVPAVPRDCAAAHRDMEGRAARMARPSHLAGGILAGHKAG